MNSRTAYLIICALMLSYLCGCTHASNLSILKIESTESSIVMHDSKRRLLVFDKTNNRWKDKIEYNIPDLNYGNADIINMISDGENVIINISNEKYSYIYEYADKSGLLLKKKLYRNTNNNNQQIRVTGFDANYYYVISTEFRNGSISVDYFKINRQTGNRLNNHFDQFADYIVIDTTVHKGNTYHLIFASDGHVYKTTEEHVIRGKMLLQKTDTNNSKQVFSLLKDIEISIFYLSNYRFVPSSGTVIGVTAAPYICNYENANGPMCIKTNTAVQTIVNTAVNQNELDYAWYMSSYSNLGYVGINLFNNKRFYPQKSIKDNNIIRISTDTISSDYIWYIGSKKTNDKDYVHSLIKTSISDGSSILYSLTIDSVELYENSLKSIADKTNNLFRHFNPMYYIPP